MESKKKKIQKQPSKISTKKSIRFSNNIYPTFSDPQVLMEEEFSEEIDIDERVIRSSTNRHLRLDLPCSVSVENSRIFDLLQTDFPHELPHDTEWPEFNTMPPGECIQFLGEVIGCENHEDNMASFWLLDTFCEVLRQGQLKAVSNENLNVICIWFAHLLKTISVYAPTRDDFFTNVNEMLFEAETEYLETGKLLYPKDIMERLETKKNEINYALQEGQTSLSELVPLADQINIISESNETLTEAQSSKEIMNLPDEKGDAPINPNELESEIIEDCLKLNELAFLTEQIFRVFGHRFKFEVIKTVFSDPPEIQPIIIVENMNFPKELGQSQKHIQELNMKKREPPVKVKPGKADRGTAIASKKKGKVEKEQESAALEKFKTELKLIDWEREDEKEKERTRDFYIKPLEDSVNKEFFERLFPPKLEPELPQPKKTKEKPGAKGKPKKK